ncbi:MAG: ATP-dependent 6-phosphofructokinase [Candidatus Sumerlaeia bacterium]|nr:ATP-dependent 6-phosphofructokinase [Candidatus Sumerlaeia bacterium]
MADCAVSRIAILTGGGDCPGLNAVIRAIVKTAINKYHVDCYGVLDGFHGLIYRRAQQLHGAEVSGILTLGGTILGSSNRHNPFAHHMTINGTDQVVDVSDECVDFIQQQGWDCLIAIGGDGTLTMGLQFAQKGMNVVGVPKTIDNDLSATDYTFGFHTAVQTAVEAIDRLHTTALSHHRALVVEMMGRYAGHLALHAGIAGGGDVILIPEIPFDIDIVAKEVLSRSRRGKRASIIVVAEGAKPIGGDVTVAQMVKDSPDPVRLGGVAHVIAAQLSAKTGIETRATVLGHLQRGGTPVAVDRILSTRFGFHAMEMAAAGRFGRMVAAQGDEIVDVPLEDAVHQLKKVSMTDDLIAAARATGVCLGDRLEGVVL